MKKSSDNVFVSSLFSMVAKFVATLREEADDIEISNYIWFCYFSDKYLLLCHNEIPI